ncbi:MAG: hypothetical protein ABI162_07635 [Luteolibacter sp.]
MKTHSKSLAILALAGAFHCNMSYGATPLYQWNFDSADGSNTGAGAGGTLALDVGTVSGANGYASVPRVRWSSAAAAASDKASSTHTLSQNI